MMARRWLAAVIVVAGLIWLAFLLKFI